MNRNLKVLLVGAFCCLLSVFAKAALLGVNPSFPQIQFVTTATSAMAYDPGTQMFTVAALPFTIVFSGTDGGSAIVSNRSVNIQLDTDGNLVSGTNGFVVTGQFTRVADGVTNNYSGTLLQGDVVGFGWEYDGASSSFDFRVNLTGGQLQSFFICGNDLAVSFVSEVSSFTGDFTTSFNGSAKGQCGPEDLTPPDIICPPLFQVVTTPATNPDDPTQQGFIVTYPTPIVADNCDPSPIVFCDTPSGSFVALNPGDSLTITCYGIDVSGNFSTCSFTVTMGQSTTPPTCPLGFTDGGCGPVKLSSDAGKCSATYSFVPPVATNCNGQTFMATATAVDESGASIALTSGGNGLYSGLFPRTSTTNGDVITFTATDGQGNTALQQCQVFVKDTQPPQIMCRNQTATFKPILTNALSCIEADFDDGCINASNYLWFSSVIQSSSCRAPNGAFTVHISDQTIQLSVDNTNLTLTVPDAYVHFSNGVCTATTVFTNGQWVTYANTRFSGNTFASGLSWQLPFNLNNVVGNCWGRDRNSSCYRRHVNTATWCARFGVDTTGVALQWQWGAVVQSKATTNCVALGVKPIDDDHDSCWKNQDPAGSCENFKQNLVCGGRGRGCSYSYGYGYGGQCQYQYDCTGLLSSTAPCNLGKGIVCEGAVNFATPAAADNCDNSVTVTCNPPSGSLFGPGTYPITCTAVDSSGNSNQCGFTLTVLPPVQVVFDSPSCDNFADNTCQPDAGFTDFNCPDDPSTSQYVNTFYSGSKVCHSVRLLDCNGNDVTSSLVGCVTVHIDVCERQGTYGCSTVVTNVPQNYSCTGSPGGVMVPCNGAFQYNLDTTGYQSGTCNNNRFFRSCVWVEYNSSPGCPVGMEDVIMESR